MEYRMSTASPPRSATPPWLNLVAERLRRIVERLPV